MHVRNSAYSKASLLYSWNDNLPIFVHFHQNFDYTQLHSYVQAFGSMTVDWVTTQPFSTLSFTCSAKFLWTARVNTAHSLAVGREEGQLHSEMTRTDTSHSSSTDPQGQHLNLA